MKCSQCDTEFEGRFCPECGFAVEGNEVTESDKETDSQIQYGFYPVTKIQELEELSSAANSTSVRGISSLIRHWKLILVGVVAFVSLVGAAVVVNFVFNEFLNVDRIKWSDVELAEVIPEPPSKKGTLYDNSDDRFYASLNRVSDSQYNKYLHDAEEMGFTVDSEKSSYSYKGYNDEGYCLKVSHYEDELSIELNSPIEFIPLNWPKSKAGKQLPVPKSDIGKFSYEHEDSFLVYVGDTAKEDYVEYVNACAAEGFDVDYSKGDGYYYASNSDGWNLSLTYEGNSIMSISINEP